MDLKLLGTCWNQGENREKCSWTGSSWGRMGQLQSPRWCPKSRGQAGTGTQTILLSHRGTGYPPATATRHLPREQPTPLLPHKTLVEGSQEWNIQQSCPSFWKRIWKLSFLLRGAKALISLSSSKRQCRSCYWTACKCECLGAQPAQIRWVNSAQFSVCQRFMLLNISIKCCEIPT